MLSVVLLSALAASADVKISLSDLVFKANETKEVSITLENDDYVLTGIGGDIIFPKGFTFVNLNTNPKVAGVYVQKTNRCPAAWSVLSSTANENQKLVRTDGRSVLRLSALQSSNNVKKAIAAGKGAVFTFKVTAPADWDPTNDDKVEFSKFSVSGIGEANESKIFNKEVKMLNSNKRASFSAENISVTPNHEATVTVSMDNSENMGLTALQCDITLPEGLTFVENEEGDVCIPADRLHASSHNITAPTNETKDKLRAIIQSDTNLPIQGTNGALFTFNVTCKDDFKTGEIEISGIKGAFISGELFDKFDESEIKITVTNPDVEANAEADEALKALEGKVANTIKAFGEYADTVQTVLKEQKEALEKKLADVKEAAKVSKEKGTAAADLETLKAAIAETEAMATKLIEDADKTKKEIEDKAAAEKANADQYGQDTLAVANAEKALSDAIAGMAEYDESVKAAFAEAQTAAKAALTAAKDAVKKSFEAGTAVADKEANAALVAAVNEAAAKMATEAKAAQEKFLADKAAAEANAAQYAKDSTALANVQKALDDAVAGMAEYDESVKTAMQGAIATAQAEINVAKVQIEASFAAATSVADATKNAALVEKAQAVVAKVASDAKAAQDKFLADKDAKALEAAYAQATAVVTDLNKALATAQKTIATECADVKDSEAVVAAAAAVKAQITALSEAIEAAKADRSLTTTIETVLAPKAEIETAIAKMVEDAKAAQKVVDDKKAALDAAYAYAQQELASLKTSFATAQETIAKECADVKNSDAVVAAAAAIEAQIAAAAEAVEAAKADGSLVNKKDELVAKKAEVEAAIAKMVEDAKAAQKDFEAQKALDAAYAQAQELLNGLNQKLANAQDAINTFCPDVKDGETVTAAVDAVKAQIAAAAEAIEAAKADGTLIDKKDELLSKKTEIEAAISQLPAIAQKAQKDFEAQKALDAAYAQATAVLNSLNQKLANAMEAINEFCPDVKDSSLVVDGKAAIEAQIATLSDAIEAAKADGSLTAEIVNILTPKTAIETAIDQLKADAKKAQHDIDTAIEGVEGSENISKIYTLSGKEVSRAEKGQVYIIRYVNGSTKKVMVK